MASKKINLAAPVAMAKTTAGRSTPGQKKLAGKGVIVKSHTVAQAIALEIPDIYANTLAICHDWSAPKKVDVNLSEYN
jgi:hypothetical protein